MLLSPEERYYYARQIVLDEIGTAGQIKLKKTKVLCIGAGGLGSPLLQYLTAAGVGTIGIMDHDVIDMSNLSRQTIYKHADIGIKKVRAAKEYLIQLNPFVKIHSYPERLRQANALGIIAEYDIVADCTDDLSNRYLTNKICVAMDKPFAFAGIWRHQGQCMLFQGQKGPCFNCLFPVDNTSPRFASCSDFGVLGVLPGMLGIMQANLIIQYIVQSGDIALGKLLMVNSRHFDIRSYQLYRSLDCELCNY
jgi:molybdopterin/thiamine biosynthesis adenylyltransferase